MKSIIAESQNRASIEVRGGPVTLADSAVERDSKNCFNPQLEPPRFFIKNQMFLRKSGLNAKPENEEQITKQ